MKTEWRTVGEARTRGFSVTLGLHQENNYRLLIVPGICQALQHSGSLHSLSPPLSLSPQGYLPFPTLPLTHRYSPRGPGLNVTCSEKISMIGIPCHLRQPSLTAANSAYCDIFICVLNCLMSVFSRLRALE